MEGAPYDLALAVQAFRTLVWEAHDQATCTRLVWQPSHFWLTRLAAERPTRLTCLHEPFGDSQCKNQHCNVYLVAPGNRIIYLGTVIPRWLALQHREHACMLMPHKAGVLKLQDPLTIVRWWAMCSIPTESNVLTKVVLHQAMQRYFQQMAPALAGLPIEWLPEAEQLALTSDIMIQARQSAVIPTVEQRAEVYRRDTAE